MDIYVVNIVLSKLVKTKSNSKYFVGYSDKDIRPVVLIMPKIIPYYCVLLSFHVRVSEWIYIL